MLGQGTAEIEETLESAGKSQPASNVGLARTELLHLNSELARMKRESESVYEAMATLSHEIRTPLTAILGSTEALLDEAPTYTQWQELVQTIKRNGQHLLGLVNDVLEMSRVDAGLIKLNATTFQPMDLLDEVASSLRPLATSKGLLLELVGVAELPFSLICDQGRLRQILLNLLGNAMRFTTKGSVTLAARFDSSPEGPFLVVDIRDTGIGIGQDCRRKIFEPYGQACAPVGPFGGTGLGLVISRRLARLMGGDIALVASEPGKGSTFRAWVRAVPCQRVESKAGLGLQTESESACCRSSTVLRSMRILVAEDSIDNQRLIVRILEKAGATITSVGNGRDAANAALRAKRRGEPFAVVLMDVYMPRMGGEEAVRRLRDRGYDGRVIALTACAMPGERERIMKAGFDRYLAKPINRVQLIDTLAECNAPVRCNPEPPTPTRTHNSLGSCTS